MQYPENCCMGDKDRRQDYRKDIGYQSCPALINMLSVGGQRKRLGRGKDWAECVYHYGVGIFFMCMIRILRAAGTAVSILALLHAYITPMRFSSVTESVFGLLSHADQVGFYCLAPELASAQVRAVSR